VALVQILLKEQYGVLPEVLPFPIDAAPEAIAGDALLMIGDRALRRPRGAFVAELDLGEAGRQWAKLPFVFAMWVAGQESGVRSQESGELSAALAKSRDLGVAQIGRAHV